MSAYFYIKWEDVCRMLNLMRDISRLEFMAEVLKGRYIPFENIQDYYEALNRKYCNYWYYSGYSKTVMRRDSRSDYWDVGYFRDYERHTRSYYNGNSAMGYRSDPRKQWFDNCYLGNRLTCESYFGFY